MAGRGASDGEDGGRARHLVRDRQQRITDRRVLGADEGQTLRAEVAGCPALGVGGEVAVVEVVDEVRCRRVVDVEGHDAAGPLEAYEGVGAPVDLSDGDALRLRTLVV